MISGETKIVPNVVAREIAQLLRQTEKGLVDQQVEAEKRKIDGLRVEKFQSVNRVGLKKFQEKELNEGKEVAVVIEISSKLCRFD